MEELRAEAIQRTFFPPTSLGHAIRNLGFVQADPIRSPARAQDLILRHRAKDYRAGDLEKRYPKLDVEEDFLYAYGFLPRENWQLLHPRDQSGLTALEQKVLSVVRGHEKLHPRELEKFLGKRRTVNAWGGYSKETTHALHRLHYKGLLRISGREAGIRIYEATEPYETDLSPGERLRRIALLIANILAPVPVRSLRETLRYLAHAAPHLEGRSTVVRELLDRGDLEEELVGDLPYVRPRGSARKKKAPLKVRFLAPFDPLVWDRRRFEHLWGWSYRFEAYTPPAKRKMGYYAMPVLWKDAIVGWVNIQSRRTLQFKLGFVNGKPEEADFADALEQEKERFRHFLACGS